MRRALIPLLAVLAACVPSAKVSERAPRIPTPVAGAHTGGTLRVAITPPDGIDPTGAHEPIGELITSTMCDQLIAFDPLTGEPRPSLAESWTVGDGGRNLFIRLRAGARFSNGTPLTAEDVVFSLSRLANERFASPSASLLSEVAGYGFTHGEVDTKDEHLRQSLLGVSIVEGRTLSISLTSPLSEFFAVLAHPATSPVPRTLVMRDAGAFARAPVCAGPYRLASSAASSIVLKRVLNYVGANSSMTRGGAGYADTIEFNVFASRAAGVAAFRRGAVDVAQVPESDRRAAPSGSRLEVAPSLQTEFIGLPTTKPPFDDARVRAALSRALDRARLAALYGDRRTVASAFFPSFLDPGAVPAGCSANAPARADMPGALALLKAAGVDPATLKPTFAFNDEFGNRSLVTEIARQWRAGLGVRAVPAPMPWERYRVLAGRPQGFDGVFRFGWAPRVPSVHELVVPLFTTNGIGKDNWSQYSSRDLSDASRQLDEGADARTRRAQARRAHEILCDDMPMIPLLQFARAYVVRASVASAVMRAGGVDGQPLLREFFVG